MTLSKERTTLTQAGPARKRDPRMNVDVEAFLIELADALNSTLELDEILKRVAELVRKVIDFEIFAILLLNEKTQEMRMRFQIGHTQEVERLRIKVGQGVSGTAAKLREPVLVGDVRQYPNYINAHPGVRSELSVPLLAKSRLIGVIDIQALEPNYFNSEHSRLLSLVGSRIAMAVENARLYSRIARQAKTLQLLNEISRELVAILKLDELFRRIAELLTKIIDYQMFSILLLDSSGQILQHRFSLRFKESIQLKHDIPLGRGLVGAAASSRQPVWVPDVSKDPRYISLNPETRSELCVPLVYKDKLIGVLDVEHTRRNYFTEEHQRTLTTLAAQIAIAIENATLYERIAMEEQRLERELIMAREVQMRLLPPQCPVLKHSEIAAKFVPARTIGGDVYDFLEYTGGRTGLAVGDVSGKGAPAALFAALVAGIIRSTATVEPGPAEMLESINVSLNERRIEAQFVSMLFAIWDDEHQTMVIANSGQPRPIYCHNGEIEVVEAAGIPLGLFEDTDYDEVPIQAHPGDLFLLFSDGILDATDPEGDLFGRTRLEDLVRQNCEKGASELVDLIFQQIKEFSGGECSFDDETVVILKVKDTAPIAQEPARRKKKTDPMLREV